MMNTRVVKYPESSLEDVPTTKGVVPGVQLWLGSTFPVPFGAAWQIHL